MEVELTKPSLAPIRKAPLAIATYVERLAHATSQAQPFFKQSPLHQPWKECERNNFPREPGVYLILRSVRNGNTGYRYAGLVPASPLVLYVGRTTSRRSIYQRLCDHFGAQSPNFQGSQFLKFLMQVVQDEEIVKRIIWSPTTTIASVAVPENESILAAVERLAIAVFAPRFNI